GSAERSPHVVGGSLPITGCLGAWPRPRGGGPEPALEPAPGEAGGVQEVAEVATVHAVLSDLHGVAGRAVVHQRLWVADDRLPIAAQLTRQVTVGGGDAVRVPGDQVERAGCRGAEGRAVGVVAHGEGLGVVPQRGHGIAVVVVHDVAGLAPLAVDGGRTCPVAGELRELVHRATVEGLLLLL